MKTLESHIKNFHKLDPEAYHLEHISNVDHCLDCNKKTKFRNLEHGFYKYCDEHIKDHDYFVCQLCNEPVETITKLQFHIKGKHTISVEEYYLRYMGTQVICECGKPVRFSGSLRHPYGEYCSNGCVAIFTRDQASKTLEEHYGKGVTNPMMSKEIQDKVRTTVKKIILRTRLKKPTWKNMVLKIRCNQSK